MVRVWSASREERARYRKEPYRKEPLRVVEIVKSMRLAWSPFWTPWSLQNSKMRAHVRITCMLQELNVAWVRLLYVYWLRVNSSLVWCIGKDSIIILILMFILKHTSLYIVQIWFILYIYNNIETSSIYCNDDIDDIGVNMKMVCRESNALLILVMVAARCPYLKNVYGNKMHQRLLSVTTSPWDLFF